VFFPQPVDHACKIFTSAGTATYAELDLKTRVIERVDHARNRGSHGKQSSPGNRSRVGHRLSTSGRRLTAALAMTDERLWGPIALQDGLTRFQIGAPAEPIVSAELDGRPVSLVRSQEGWQRVEVEALAGTAYGFVLGNGRI